MEFENLVALGLLLLTVLSSRGMPIPVVAAVVAASSSTIVAAVAVASSSRCSHCVVLGTVEVLVCVFFLFGGIGCSL